LFTPVSLTSAMAILSSASCLGSDREGLLFFRLTQPGFDTFLCAALQMEVNSATLSSVGG
jgi:hypothetical protein